MGDWGERSLSVEESTDTQESHSLSCSGFLVGHIPPPALKHAFESVGWEPALSPVGFWEEGPALARSRALRTPFLAYSQSREPEVNGVLVSVSPRLPCS